MHFLESYLHLFSIEMEQAVEVYKSLRNAAGLFDYIKRELLGKMKAKPEKGSDLDPTVLEAYTLQSLAEAQEGITCSHTFEELLLSFSYYCSCYGIKTRSFNYCCIGFRNCNLVREVQ